jgi:uncharacterized RDD family membrane protein YckC
VIPAPPQIDQRLASIGQRIVGFVIDGVILAVPVSVLVLVYADINLDKQVFSIPTWISYAIAAISVGYHLVLVRWRGQTVGKMVMRTKVVRADGSHLGWHHAALRALVPVAVGVLPLGFLAVMLSIGVYFVALWDPHRQGLHDKAAGTVVVALPPA